MRTIGSRPLRVILFCCVFFSSSVPFRSFNYQRTTSLFHVPLPVSFYWPLALQVRYPELPLLRPSQELYRKVTLLFFLTNDRNRNSKLLWFSDTLINLYRYTSHLIYLPHSLATCQCDERAFLESERSRFNFELNVLFFL